MLSPTLGPEPAIRPGNRTQWTPRHRDLGKEGLALWAARQCLLLGKALTGDSCIHQGSVTVVYQPRWGD